MSNWYLSHEKVKTNLSHVFKKKISLDLWRKIVEEDKDLYWSEDTPFGKEANNSGAYTKDEIKNKEKLYAHMDIIPKYGHGGVQLNYINNGFIYILHTRDSLKRIEKYFALAKKLGAYLYRSGTTLIDEKKMEKIRSKYLEKGKIAPKEE
jgi:hypothetical protein